MQTNNLAHKKVLMHKPSKKEPDNTKKVGRIRSFVFHPKKAKMVGYLVKRPDVALMFHRDDLFVPLGGFEEIDGTLVIKDERASSGKLAAKELASSYGVNLDECVIWVGLPVLTEDGKQLGMIDNIQYDSETGKVGWLELGGGATADVLLGHIRIPVEMIKGFRRGRGARLYMSDDDDPESFGAIVVTNEAATLEATGGVAEKAGSASAKAGDKVKRTYNQVAQKAKDESIKAQPKVEQVTTSAGSAIKKGVYAAGRQIGRADGMFANFKSEFQRALNGEEKEDTSGKGGGDA